MSMTIKGKQWRFLCGSWQLVPEPEPTKDEKKRKALAMHFAQLERDAQKTFDHKNGYCPHCHMLIPLNGVCDCQ